MRHVSFRDIPTTQTPLFLKGSKEPWRPNAPFISRLVRYFMTRLRERNT